jgi:hypothetical protein
MITLELNVMGDAYQPFIIPKDSQRSVVKTVHYKVLFAFELSRLPSGRWCNR